jgi:serine/threonine-protein kinase
MDKLLKAGFLLEDRFRVADVLGHSERSAAYLAADLAQGGSWTLVWESLDLFRMKQQPRGALHYLEYDERHYLLLRLEGQDLGLVSGAAGVVAPGWAALWMAQICDGIGQWHARSGTPLVCLTHGDIRLADLRLMATGRAILPTCDLLSNPVEEVVPGQSLSFSAPEKIYQRLLIPQSDVYALGGALYCLVTGAPPPDPRALVEGRAELVRPRKIQRKLSGRLERAILKALRMDPRERYETARQFGFELDRCVPGRLRRQK